jgi:hypothetical protein
LAYGYVSPIDRPRSADAPPQRRTPSVPVLPLRPGRALAVLEGAFEDAPQVSVKHTRDDRVGAVTGPQRDRNLTGPAPATLDRCCAHSLRDRSQATHASVLPGKARASLRAA